MTRRELLARMDSEEITEWMAYYRLEPFGEYRADIRNAMLCQLIAQVNSTGKRFKLAQFMPVFFRKPQTDEEAKAKLAFFAKTRNAGLKG